MYSPKIIKAKAAKIEKLTPLRLKEHSLSEIDYWVERLQALVPRESTDKNPILTRNLREDEQQFIQNEIAMCKISYPYWATRYGKIKTDKGGLARIKFWESQEMLLSTIGALEEMGLPILIMNLKARQVGSSTVSESILTHKVTNNHGITSLVASDEPPKSEFLFNMMGRILEHLPFYLKPHRKYEVKGQQLVFDQLDSHIFVDSGNKRTGGIGQGMTVHCGHLSELATWNNPEMISEDLIPAILSGASPNTFFILESTAKGRSGSWYMWWKACKRKKFHGFVPVFIPWWAIKEKYAANPELGWGPSERVLKLAQMLHNLKGVDLTRKQMYWWDKTYESYKEEDRLDAFFAEYASDDDEAFQLSGRTVFPLEKLNDLRRNAKAQPIAIYELQERLILK
jgi:hypothetical protein